MKKRIKIFTAVFIILLSGLIYRTNLFRNTGSFQLDDTPSDALNGLQFLSAQRSYPETDIPADGYYKAYEYSTRILKKREMDLDISDTWQSIGPVNQGGRTNALAIDPNNPDIIYAGSASGGLWRSSTGGTGQGAWEYIETGFPVLGVNAIAIDPENSDVIYIGTGEVYWYRNSIGGLYNRLTRGSYGIGLLKTIDGGKTWTKSIDWTVDQRRGVLDIELNPLNPDVIYAGTSEGVYKSIDAGETWRHVHEITMAVDVDINPVDTNMVFVSCGNLGSSNSGIYRSTHSGEPGTWIKLEGGIPSDWTGKTLIDIYRSSPNLIFADVAEMFFTRGLYRSTDYGDTWELVTDFDYANYQGWFSHYVRVNPVDSTNIIVAGINFYRSTDEGENFYKISGMHVDHHCFANHPTDPDMVYFGNDGGIYKSPDNGSTFEICNDGYITTQFYAGFSSSPTDSNIAFGGLQDNNSVKYYGSKYWLLNLIGGDGGYTAINPDNNDIVYGSTQGLRIRRSSDGGNGWQDIYGGLMYNDVCFIAPFVISQSNPSILYAGTDYFFRTLDGGDSWEARNSIIPIDGNPIISIAVSPDNPNIVYAATVPAASRAGVYSSINGGATWTNITGDLPDRYFVDLTISPVNDNVVYITASGFGSSHLFRSTNSGETWTDIGNGLPDVPTSAVAIDPENPDCIYVGNDLGVYVSSDVGTTWTEFKEGMPTAALVMDLSICQANRTIRAVTHGNGVYQRPLIGNVQNIEDDNIITGYELYQNFPNPFNSETMIKYDLPKTEKVLLEIFNIQGRHVETLINFVQSPGTKYIPWIASKYASDVYIARLKAGNYTSVKKMILVK